MRFEAPRLLRTPRARALGYAQLVRPPNLPTAAADALAGAAIAGGLGIAGFALLPVASVLLYAGGVALNDAFDAGLDAHERPERAIPSGRVGRTPAFVFGSALLLAGVGCAALVNAWTAAIAFVLAVTIVAYDGYAKPRALLGPVVMGACRALNLLLGLALVPAVLYGAWPLAALAFAHVTVLTVFARGEVGGGRAPPAWSAAVVSLAVASVLALLAIRHAAPAAFVFIAPYVWMTYPRYAEAARRPDPLVARRAVKYAVLALVLLDAALAAIYAGFAYGLAVAALLALSVALARRFAVA